MEKLTPRCKLIILGATASLIAAIAASPAAPGIPFLLEAEKSPPLSSKPPFATEVEALPNCAGGGSLYCHRSGNLAGL